MVSEHSSFLANHHLFFLLGSFSLLKPSSAPPHPHSLMAIQNATTSPTSTLNIHDTHESYQTLISINVSAQAPLKLTTTNYVSLRLQSQTLFISYDLLGYIDGTKPCSPTTLIAKNTLIPNPTYFSWLHQDQLILNALINPFSHNIIPFIACATISREAWTILANT